MAGSYDVCRDALVHLMTGCKFVQEQYSSFIFTHVFEDSINSWLWFRLKIASFEFSQKKVQSILDPNANKSLLPSNYIPYFLEDLV